MSFHFSLSGVQRKKDFKFVPVPSAVPKPSISLPRLGLSTTLTLLLSSHCFNFHTMMYNVLLICVVAYKKNIDLETSMNLYSSSSKMQKSNEDQDIISNLPDVIIGHILSLLSTREAVRTSVLSKRWEYMWTSITKLHFNDKEQYEYRTYIRKNSFLNSVYRVLLHLNSSSIQSLSVSISENYDPYHVNQWISALISRKVKEICIHSVKTFGISSNSTLWKSPYLENLTLSMKAYPIIIRRPTDYDMRVTVPTNVDFLSLTVLNLSGITLTCAPSNYMRDLILKFPALRKFETVDCTWLNVKLITLDMPKLEVLIISDTNVFTADGSPSVINLFALHLAEFSYSGFMSDASWFPLYIESIASANIYPRRCVAGVTEAQNAYFAYQFLRKLSNKVKCLKFEQPQVLVLAVPRLFSLPEFGKLSRLELRDKIMGPLLWILLGKSPWIETLTLQELIIFDHRLTSMSVPPCVACKLKVVNFGRFRGDEHELRFVKVVIENAQVLKRMSLTCEWTLCGPKLEEVREKIFSFKKSASSAVIELL
ncbi:unnamed protein product [Sphenostylis stenocarpa]|uniref:F-box domain-containing protein n=1 Tax=Sphenostylis stenocarpa TaxID=92480 RepID=A0AA86STD6_9FABA|nr:unnamed protein product [Sphenostylis stenocarpa]